MTVIAYDGKVIAADRQLTSSDVIFGYATKLQKWSGGMWTSTGRMTDHILFGEWLENRKSKFVPYKDFSGFFTENGKVYEIDYNLVPYPAMPKTALGDGGKSAQILMQAGFSAKQAIKEVCKTNIYCGGKVDVVNV